MLDWRLTTLFLLILLPTAAPAFREGPQEGSVSTDQEFKEMLRDREAAREKAGVEFQKSQEQPAEMPVTVKIRRKDGDQEGRGTVIAQGQMTTRELEQGNWAAIHTRVRSNSGLSGADATAATTGNHSVPELSSRARATNWVLCGILGLAGIVWLASRRYEIPGVKS
jgi:hypothetical protein